MKHLTNTPEAVVPEEYRTVVISTSILFSNPDQPRQIWEEDQKKDAEGKSPIDRLADDIKAHGLQHPIIVTPREKKRKPMYMIVCGERRFRACMKAKLKQVPCIVKKGLSDAEVLEMSITENLQRRDLNAMEEAKAVQLLMTQCRCSQKKVATKLNLSVAAVNYKLALLELPKDVQRDISTGKLTETQGRAIAQETRKVPAAQRNGAASAIKEKIDKAREAKPSKKVNTKDVRTIARTTAAHHIKPAGTTKGTPAPKPAPVKPITGKEKDHAKKFSKAMATVERALLPFAKTVLTKESGGRFARAVRAVTPKSEELVNSAHVFLGRVLSHTDELKREVAARKVQ